jgi:hypothetical protein
MDEELGDEQSLIAWSSVYREITSASSNMLIGTGSPPIFVRFPCFVGKEFLFLPLLEELKIGR